MARGILVTYAGYPYSFTSLMPDNGLASLAGALTNDGHEVTILDYNTLDTIRELVPRTLTATLRNTFDSFTEPKARGMLRNLWAFSQLKAIEGILTMRRRVYEKRIAQELVHLARKERVDFVGFKLWNGDGLEGTATLVRTVRRELPSVRLFGGGPHAYSFQSRLLEYMPQLDALSIDESEATIVGLARYAEGRSTLSAIPNILFRNVNECVHTPLDKISDLDSLPLPDYSDAVYPSLYHGGKLRVAVIDESRGCMFSCPFCVQSSRPDNRFRAKSVGRIIEEIEALHRRGYRLFRFGGQMTPGRLLEDICRRLRALNLAISCSCFGHVGCLRNVDFALLRSAGLKSIFLGIETADDQVMEKAMGRKFSVADAEKAITDARAAGIAVAASFIHPLPFSTEDTADRNLAFVERTRPDSVLVYFPGIFPGTPWATNPERYGCRLSKRFLDVALRYKIKHLFPPRFWSPLPYEIDGKSHRRFSGETEALLNRLTEMGQSLFLTDDIFLVADHLQVDAHSFGSDVRRALYCGDVEFLAEAVARVNGRS